LPGNETELHTSASEGAGIVVLYGVIVPGMICISLAPLDLDAC